MTTPPDGRQPRWSPDRPGPPRPPGAPDDSDEARLDPREQARIDEAVIRVRRDRGAGPVLMAAVVVAAFLVGLVRPWDWLAGDTATGGGPGDGAGATAANGGEADGQGDGSIVAGGDGAGAPTVPLAPFQAATCGFPASWRTAAVSFWAGRRARIWTAAEAVPASGPADPGIPFTSTASDRVEAIGWCAPVSGPDRPPLAAVGTLFRVREGVATQVAFDRLEPAAPDALGELWVPPAQSVGRRPVWAPGRYVVRLATPSGSYERYLGLEVGLPEPDAAPGTPGEAPAPTAGPSAAAGPG